MSPFAFASPLPGIPASGDPDIPAATLPIATIVVLDNSVYSYTAGFRGLDITIPVGWNRAVIEFTATPMGDPWDRTFAASIAGVEVLRGTTPRAPMTVEKDVTRYSALMPEGSVVRIEGYTDSWVAALAISVTMRFYADPSALLVSPPVDSVVNVQRFGGLCTGGSFTRTVDFGDAPPSAATIELFLSGHGQEEFWFQNQGGPRIARVAVDGTEVGHAVMLPYTYAFLGFAGAGGSAGPTQVLIHRLMWWTAQLALDKVGVHVNSGEIPPFRIAVDEDQLGLFTGTRQVTVSMETTTSNVVRCTWTTSASMLLDA